MVYVLMVVTTLVVFRAALPQVIAQEKSADEIGQKSEQPDHSHVNHR
jgi:hypothetical protein